LSPVTLKHSSPGGTSEELTLILFQDEPSFTRIRINMTATTITMRKRNENTRNSDAAMSDEELLILYCATGDRDYYSRLLRKYERELFSYLRRYLGDAEMAEDAFQAAFLQVHLKRESFQEGRKFRPWLYAIATNQAIDAQRRNKRHRMVSLDRSGAEDNDEVGSLVDLLVSGDVDPFDHMHAMERKEQMQQSLDQLPSHMREVVDLVYYQGLKYREAADALEIPVGTVKSRLHAAIHRLTQAWSGQQVELN